MIRNYLTILLLFVLSLAICQPVLAQEASSVQKRQIKKIAANIDRATKLVKSNKLKMAASKVNESLEQIQYVAATANASVMKQLQSELNRVTKLHKKLTDNKIEVLALEPLPEPMAGSSNSVSFVSDVAPIIVRNCGRCHVNQSRGQFSAKDYGSLMNSLHVSAGRPDRSRLIEVITDGSMPPNGTVNKNDQLTLSNWIRQGAKFDGPDQGINLTEFARTATANNPNGPGGNRARLVPTKPTGTETVSFGLHVAPIIVESCGGCHLETRRIRGNFNMNNFARLLRGGDSGNPLLPGSPAESTLIKRLRGVDSEVMPPRKKLSEKKIKTVETWIAEGATFDGLAPGMDMKNVVKTAKAESQTHEQLAKSRDKLSVKNWQLIMSSDKPGVYEDNNFRILGSGRSGSERLENAASMANDLSQQIMKELRSDAQQPFVKGKPTIFVFERRYDLNELGKMLASKELPKDQTSRWEYSIVDAYVSLLLSRGREPAAIKAELAQQLAAVHVAGMARDVPRWFADGVGYQTAARILRKSKDGTTKSWKTSAARIVENMEQPGSFALGQMSERDSGLAGYAFVDEMKRKRSLAPIMKLLQKGTSFEDAFASEFDATPRDYFRPPRRQRGQRNRRR